MARCAAIGQTAHAFAARAGEAEAHGAGHLGHIAAAVAFRTDGIGAGAGSSAVAGGAHLLAVDFQPDLCAAGGLPEIDGEAIFEVGALFGTGRLRLPPAPRPFAQGSIATPPFPRLGR